MRTLRFRLPCRDEADFQQRFARKIANEGLFIASRAPPPVGERLALRLEMREAGPAVSAEAIVAEHSRAHEKDGFVVQLLKLDASSIQFALASVPAPTSAPGPATKVVPRQPGAAPWPPPPARFVPQLASEAMTRPEPNRRGRPGAPEPKTRCFQYSKADLIQAGAIDAWEGGLQPLDLVGDYQLLVRLGIGGMAEVFLARSRLAQGFEKLVALKMVLPEFGPGTEFGALFLNEARISLTLQHPNLIQVFDFGEALGRPFLAMEYVEGFPISRMIRGFRLRGRFPPVEMGVAVAIELCKALEYVHEKRDLDGQPLNLVHRDVSSGNVMISELGEIKLVDFGVAALSDSEEAARQVVGKRGYVSPEQSRGGTPRPSWDIYSAGVLLDEMLTLRPPSPAESPDPSQLTQRSRPPPSAVNPAIPAELDRIVLCAAHPHPDLRPGSARELRELLEQVRAKLPPCDLAALLREMAGAELTRRKAEAESLISRARKRSIGRPSGDWPLLRPLLALRRRIASSRAWVRMSRHPVLLRLGAFLLALLLLGTLAVTLRWQVQERQLGSRLQQADERIASARLVGPNGDAALDVLLAARRIAPGDERVEGRLRALADTLERLGRLAEARGDFAEAAMHLQAALNADPGRDPLRARIEALEQRVRSDSLPQGRSQP